MLVLDAGSALVGQWAALKSEGRVMVEAMNALGYDAMAIGRMDLAVGLEAALERAQEAEFPFLSANVVNSDGTPVFQPYTLLEQDGVRVGILGLTEPEAIQVPGMPGDVKVLDYIEVAAQYVPELRPQVDLLIVLSHVGFDQDIALAGTVEGIDIIVGGNTRKLMQQPERVGNTLIVQQGYLGEWLGKLTATFQDGQPVAYQEEILTLGPDYDDDPAMVELLAPWRELYPTPTPRATPAPQVGPVVTPTR